MKAYRIVNWWKFEITAKGRLATAKTPMKDIRKTPLVFVRFPVHGHILTADYRRMVKRAGSNAMACDGLYKALVGLAGSQVREYRGWILDDRQLPMDPKQVAELLLLPEEQVQQIYAILMDEDVKWLELVEFPKALCRPGKTGVSLGGKWSEAGVSMGDKWSEAGVSMEKNGIALNETETEDKDKGFDSKRIETEKGDFGKNQDREGDDLRQDVRDPAQPAAQASASASVPGSAPGSVSQRPSASDSAPVSDSDSASRPGQRAGPEEHGSCHVSEQHRFDIIRECQKATLEFTQIIHPRNNSDLTTINDIFSQLKYRLISGSPYPLFELALNTARQCWRGDKPIAMFVAAMKKPPFYYVPKKLNVIPGKFSRVKDNE